MAAIASLAWLLNRPVFKLFSGEPALGYVSIQWQFARFRIFDVKAQRMPVFLCVPGFKGL
jgi:hypothetical protein